MNFKKFDMNHVPNASQYLLGNLYGHLLFVKKYFRLNFYLFFFY